MKTTAGEVPDRSPEQGTKSLSAILHRLLTEMEPLGFHGRDGSTIWRRTKCKYDVLKLDIIPNARCRKWRVPIGSFGLDPSCLFPFLPRPGYAQEAVALLAEGYGQVRLLVERGTHQSAVGPQNVWEPSDGKRVELDVLDAVTKQVLPFFLRFEDPHELLRTFLEDDDGIGRDGISGIWDFGKIGSPLRLLYTGFAAIECRQWDLAVFNLRRCREVVEALPLKEIAADMLPYAAQGIEHAASKRSWPR